MDNSNDNDNSLPGASERIQRILSSTVPSRLLQSSSGQGSLPVPTRPPPQNRNSQEEMAQAFPALYRSRAYPYNPQWNHGPTSRPGPSCASGSGRSGGSHLPYKQKPMVKNFVKKVVLVKPEEVLVLKGRKRQQACDEGRVIDMMEFHSN